MSLTKRSLSLPASPPSVKLARSWVSAVLSEIGREALLETARLGVSELVTNALIHSRPPLLLRVLGTKDHPRIEVVDSSPIPPERIPVAPAIEDVDDLNLTTFGRGLDLVAMVAARWGSDLGHDGRTKTVWFEPADEAGEQLAEGEIFTFDPDLTGEATTVDRRRMTIRLLDVPAQLFGQLRRYHFELRRELRLLAMTAPEDYPIATRVTEMFARVEQERRTVVGISALDDAIARGLSSIDLVYEVPLTAPETMRRMRDMLDEVYETFSSENLLAVRPPELLVELQTWYLTEFERQGRGETPLRWTGPRSLTALSTSA